MCVCVCVYFCMVDVNAPAGVAKRIDFSFPCFKQLWLLFIYFISSLFGQLIFAISGEHAIILALDSDTSEVLTTVKQMHIGYNWTVYSLGYIPSPMNLIWNIDKQTSLFEQNGKAYLILQIQSEQTLWIMQEKHDYFEQLQTIFNLFKCLQILKQTSLHIWNT